MGTLSSELADLADPITEGPQVYADANLPVGLVRFMRERLKWDVFFVMEDAGLRRAPDRAHFRLAGQMRRTLLTLDRDYLDDARFPCGECAGVVVLSAPREEQFQRLLQQIDRVLFHHGVHMPLSGRKLHVQSDWSGELEAR